MHTTFFFVCQGQTHAPPKMVATGETGENTGFCSAVLEKDKNRRRRRCCPGLDRSVWLARPAGLIICLLSRRSPVVLRHSPLPLAHVIVFADSKKTMTAPDHAHSMLNICQAQSWAPLSMGKVRGRAPPANRGHHEPCFFFSADVF